MNPIHAIPPCFLKIRLNIIHPLRLSFYAVFFLQVYQPETFNHVCSLPCPSYLIFDLFTLLYGEQYNHEASHRQFFSLPFISVLCSSAPNYPAPSVCALIWMWHTKYRAHTKLQVLYNNTVVLILAIDQLNAQILVL